MAAHWASEVNDAAVGREGLGSASAGTVINITVVVSLSSLIISVPAPQIILDFLQAQRPYLTQSMHVELLKVLQLTMNFTYDLPLSVIPCLYAVICIKVFTCPAGT